MIGEDAIEPARAAAMHRVVDEIAFGFCEHVKANHFVELLEVAVRADRMPLEVVLESRGGLVPSSGKRRRALLDVLGNFGQRRPAIGP